MLFYFSTHMTCSQHHLMNTSFDVQEEAGPITVTTPPTSVQGGAIEMQPVSSPHVQMVPRPQANDHFVFTAVLMFALLMGCFFFGASLLGAIALLPALICAGLVWFISAPLHIEPPRGPYTGWGYQGPNVKPHPLFNNHTPF